MFLHRRFNTSHVVIYREIKNKKTWELCVSIHLMLLFIQFPFCDISSQNSFNTSHVVIYRLNMISTETEFIGFNTSHVVIYPDTQYVVASGYNPFQYISCCYLSEYDFLYENGTVAVSIHLMLLFIPNILEMLQILEKFQYISCCYLSRMTRLLKLNWNGVSIHLMLLFIYNTKTRIWAWTYVSIHLMLLFIGTETASIHTKK